MAIFAGLERPPEGLESGVGAADVAVTTAGTVDEGGREDEAEVIDVDGFMVSLACHAIWITDAKKVVVSVECAYAIELKVLPLETYSSGNGPVTLAVHNR